MPETLPLSPGSRAGSLDLVADWLALDFANSSSGRGGPEHLEHLRAPGDLLAWAAHAGLQLPERPRLAAGEAEALFVTALELREAIHAIGLACAERRAPEAASLAAVAGLHAATLHEAELVAQDPRFGWRWPTTASPRAILLGPLALSCVALLLDGELARVKRCDGLHCGWLFYDATKNRRRRWCEMSVCGNRAKQRALRRRRATLPA